MLWRETVAHLQFGLDKGRLGKAYTAFRTSYGLPEHKALRKTVAQLIQDNIGESESRLFRCESGGDTHSRSYIRPYTPEQVERLDRAILRAGELLGID